MFSPSNGQSQDCPPVGPLYTPFKTKQDNTMSEIKAELARQQDFLASESKGNSYPVHTLLSQNALRERIRNAERRFLDLKCNYLNYLANAL